MATALRKTGISVVGDVPWGSHFCHFYETKQDLLDTLVPYFKAGLESNEFCVWVVTDPLTEEEARRALRKAIPDFDEHLLKENLEILDALEWYLTENVFNLERVMSAWDKRLEQALARGYDGMRVSGDTFWLRENDWRDFCAYEKQLNDSITDRRMTLLCTYPLTKSGAAEILDVVEAHQFAIARRQGQWEVIQSPEPIQAKAEIKRLNEKLERVSDLTPKRSAILRYGVAVLSVTAALIISRLMQIQYGYEPLVPFICALMFSAWFGGVKPGLLALALSLLAFHYYILIPIYPLSTEKEIPRLVVAALTSLFVVLLSAAQGNAAESLRRARDVLYGTVQELKRTNVALQAENAERKRAEDALRHSEERLRLVIDTVPALIHTGLPDGQLDFFNQRWLDFVGLSLEDLSGWKWTAAIHPEDVAAMVERWRAALATGKPYEHEARVRRVDGEYRWMVHSEVPLRDERGNIVKWYTSSIDITERKRAEEALRKSEKLFTAFMDHLPGYAWIKDVEGRYVYINETFLQFRNAVGKTDAELWPAEIASTYRANDSQVIQTKNALQTIEPFPKDPEQGCQIVSKFPILDQDGAVVMVGGASVDITERIEAEEAVRRSEEHLRLVIDTIPTMAWSLLPDGVVDFLNQPWMDYTGLSLEGYVKDPTGPIHPEDIPRVIEKWLAQKVVGEGYEEEMRLRRADGEYRWFLVRTAPLHDESGKIIKWYGVSTDIDDRKRAEEQLKVTSEHLRALSARLSSAREDEGSRIARELHDELGAALTSLKWDLEGMSKRLTEPINQKDHSVLCEKIQEMMGLVDDILSNVRRISSELRPSILDDLGLVAAIEWQAKQVESRSGIVCKVDSLVDDLQLNREQSTAIFRILQEALTNILRHAQATRVNILIDEVDGELVLEVRDNGRGITEDEIAGSLSLGLIGMQERAQLLGGRIEIIGDGERGTVLTLRVPIHGQDSALGSTPPDESLLGSG